MTVRDKLVLAIGVIILIVAAIGIFGIKPAVSNLSDARKQKAELVVKKTEMETEINALPTYQSQLDAAVADYMATSERVYGDLTNDKIHDAVINELVIPSGLSPVSFSISNVSTYAVSNFALPAGGNDQTASVNGPVQSDSSTVRMASITVNVFGTADQVITFLDRLNSDEGIYVQQASFANTAEGTTVAVAFNMVLSETY